MQSLVQIGEIALEELEKVSFKFFAMFQMESKHESGHGLHHTIQLNSRKHVDIRFNNVRHIMWELLS